MAESRPGSIGNQNARKGKPALVFSKDDMIAAAHLSRIDALKKFDCSDSTLSNRLLAFGFKGWRGLQAHAKGSHERQFVAFDKAFEVSPPVRQALTLSGWPGLILFEIFVCKSECNH